MQSTFVNVRAVLGGFEVEVKQYILCYIRIRYFLLLQQGQSQLQNFPNKIHNKITYYMQKEPPLPSEQSQAQTYLSQPGSTALPQSQITIDKHLLGEKQNILLEFYALGSDKARLQLIKKWPSQALIQAINNQSMVIKTNNAWFFGSMCNEVFHGYGLLIYENSQNHDEKSTGSKKLSKSKNGEGGRFYEGEFQNNCKHGYGLEYIYGDIYVGKYINNKPEDPNGIFLWKNNDLYIGSFLNGLKHGQGKWISHNDYYEGMWKLNKPEGIGKIHTTISDYEGEVKNGYKHGRGIELFSNGDQYEGSYLNGKPEGEGIYKWNNGAIYKGQFKNGIRYGRGCWSFGNESYEGQYINDKRNGQGFYKWGGGSYYKGQFLDDLRHGFGQMHWSEKQFYRGEWREGQQCGKGEVWENGKLISKGIFEEGKLVKETERLDKSNVTSKDSTNSQKNHHKSFQNKKAKNFFKQKQIIKSNEKQQQSIKYPSLQTKHKNHINSFHQNLSQIDEFPKVAKNSKYMPSTSFTNYRKNSGYSNAAYASYLHNSKNGYEVKQDNNINHTYKRKQQLFQVSLRGSQVKQKNPHSSSKLMNNFKKKVQSIAKTASKSVDVSVDVHQSDLQPIKWRNFAYIKNHGLDISYRMTQIRD